MEYNAITVTDLNKYIKEKFEQDEALTNIMVKGEISNYKRHYTGHLYFTLKDENSIVKCVMFKGYTERLKFEPKDGTQVIIFGTVSVYEKGGNYQIYVKAMKEDGIGDLYTKYEELKAKLEEAGMFAQSHKIKIPLMPKIVGVLTSQTGSVIRDIINVSTRRNPNVYIRLLPVPVQGDGAAEKIAKAIKTMNEKKLADVIIVARGGGSLEDLWPFNEEIVANAIYESELPVISAVGHETDFTIADFVADLRAPTPSAAAELAVPDIYELKDRISMHQTRLRVSLKKKIEYVRLRYEKAMASRVFKDPYRTINDNYLKVDSYIKTLSHRIVNKQKDEKTKYLELVSKLDTLSPLKTLTRGYCLAESNGKIVKSVNELKKDDEIDLRFTDGERKAKII
jgi:exodeoxyribonuclease VII large subunit